MSTPFLISIAILSITEPSWSIIMDRVEVPEHPVVGTSVDLICHYKLENTRAGKSEDIYSVKWYKNGKEFYRYVPKDNPPSQVFNVPWITVEQGRSNHRVVRLQKLHLKTSGIFTCEVSSEAPRFSTATGAGTMNVIDLPDERPIITGANDRGYRVGDWLDVNCTSPKSNPPSLLKWYINDELPTESYNIPIAPQKLSGDLFTARQRLRLQLKRQHFVHGDVTLKCTARIYKEYYMSTSKSYQGLGLSEKALEISGRANDGWTTRSFTSIVVFCVLMVLIN